MRIVIANSVGQLDGGVPVALYPSRCDVAMPSGTFSFYPFQLAYLSALLKREMPEHTVILVDGNLWRWNAELYIANLAESHRPDVLICECSALTYGPMTRVAVAMKQIFGTRTILAGPFGMYAPELARLAGWDHVVQGEYEAKILALLKGEPVPEEYLDLDWLPWPEDDDICRADYIEPVSPFRGIQVYSSRGCPFSCPHCVAPLYHGGHGHTARSWRGRDVDDVCAEIEHLIGKYPKTQGILFYEDTHNVNVEWTASLSEALIRHGLDKRLKFDAMVAYKPFTRDLVELMARASYVFFHMGIESLVPEMGKTLRGKGIFPDKLVQVLGWFQEFDIGVWGAVMIGASGSSQETDLATLDGMRDLTRRGLITKIQYSIATPQPGTPFFEQCRREGCLVTEDFSRYNWLESVVSYPHYSARQIEAMRARYAMEL